MTAPRTVLLTMPRGSPQVHAAARDSMWLCSAGDYSWRKPTAPGHPHDGSFHTSALGGYTVIPASPSQPTCQQTHNECWAQMLNGRKKRGLTHFAMIHTDVAAMPGWLDIMLEELDRVGADILAAHIPIKDWRGLTMTAIDFPENHWGPRRLTTTEVFERPETWTDPNVIWGCGLFVAKVDRPWVEQVAFRIIHRMVRVTSAAAADDQFTHQMISEDWDFARQARTLGAKCFVTRKVPLEHGSSEHHLKGPWGEWTWDEQNATVVAQMQREELAKGEKAGKEKAACPP